MDNKLPDEDEFFSDEISDGFFDEDLTSENKKRVTQRIPAPSLYNQKPQKAPKKKGKIRWQYIVTAVAVGICVFFSGWLTCWLTLDEEIRTILDIKKTIQNKYYKDVTDEEFYTAIFGGINDKLLDPYSGYMTPEEFQSYTADMQGSRAGIGLVFAGGDSELRILRVCGNSPAEKAGLKAGEKILGLGKTEEGVVACENFEEFSAVLGGYETKETFFLKVEGKDGARVISLYKDEYVENLLFYRTKTNAYAFEGENATQLVQKGEPMEYLDEDTAYIRLISFTGNAEKEFDEAMARFKKEGKKNLVLDLRENGGGYLNIMQAIASYFCKNTTEETPVVAIADYGEKKQEYRARGNYYKDYFQEDSRICVLADNGSASASECLIGSMLDYGAITYQDICLAERSGVAKTYGKGIMQEVYYVNIFKMDALKLTTAEIRWPKGNSIHDRGVLPSDGTLTVEQADFEEETKNAVKKWLGE